MNRVKEWNGNSKWWHYSYFLEWGVSLAATGAVFSATEAIHPYCRPFDPLDPSINHPYSHHNEVPTWMLPIVGWVIPVVWCTVLVLIFRNMFPQRMICITHEVHTLALTVGQAVGLAMCVTNPVKVYAARLRPDYVSRLIEFAHFNPHNHTDQDLAVICDSTEHNIFDGRRSFPSGHSSIAFAGWTVVACVVHARVFARRSNVSFLYLLFVALQLAVPMFVAVSRTRDYRHNYSDIAVGSLIGICSALVCYPQHYTKGLPFNRKTDSVNILDDEESIPLGTTTSV